LFLERDIIMSKQQQLQGVIENLRRAIPELKGALVASSDGLAIAHSISSGDANRVAAMTATAVSLGRRISDSIDGGELSETTVAGKHGQMLLYSAGQRGVLAVMTNGTSTNVGLIHLEAREAARAIESIL
jgi:uncharacterized protein